MVVKRAFGVPFLLEILLGEMDIEDSFPPYVTDAFPSLEPRYRIAWSEVLSARCSVLPLECICLHGALTNNCSMYSSE